jgi:hypothetical protein
MSEITGPKAESVHSLLSRGVKSFSFFPFEWKHWDWFRKERDLSVKCTGSLRKEDCRPPGTSAHCEGK